MDHFAGLDVSVKETSVCIVDDTGKIVREVKVASEPEALLVVLKNPSYRFKRIGLEAGPLSQWLFGALAEAGLPVICVETRQMRAVLKAQINKTDRNDARGMAQMMRVGLYRPVHVKTLRSQKLRMLLTHRKLLQSKAIAIDNDLRGTLRNFGLKVGMVGMAKFETRIKELVENLPDLAMLVEPLLIVRRVLREQIGILHRRLLAVVREDDVCRRLMTVPGVGPVVALTFRVTVDVPARFRNSKSVGQRTRPVSAAAAACDPKRTSVTWTCTRIPYFGPDAASNECLNFNRLFEISVDLKSASRCGAPCFCAKHSPPLLVGLGVRIRARTADGRCSWLAMAHTPAAFPRSLVTGALNAESG